MPKTEFGHDEAGKPPIWVRWFFRDVLEGTQTLSPIEELAYRRILDLIFASCDQLRDDDRALAWMTKAGRAWPKAKAHLLELGKITLEGGLIRNRRATEECSESVRFIAQKSAAGRSSADARSSLKKRGTASTAVGAPVAAVVGTDVATNLQSQSKIPASQGAAAPGQGALVEGDWAAETSGQAVGDRLYSDGLPALAALLAKPLPEQRRPVAALLGKLRREAANDAALLALILEAAAKPPADPVPWLRASLKATRGPTLALDNDPADSWGVAAWCAAHPGVSATVEPEDRVRGRFVVGGVILDVAAARVCSAAGLPRSWRGSLNALAAWIADGIPTSVIVDAVARCAARETYASATIRSLGFFDAAVREARRAAP